MRQNQHNGQIYATIIYLPGHPNPDYSRRFAATALPLAYTHRFAAVAFMFV